MLPTGMKSITGNVPAIFVTISKGGNTAVVLFKRCLVPVVGVGHP